MRCLSFSRGGQLLASAGYEPQIDVADVATGRCVATLEADFAINSLAWHPHELVLAFALDNKAGVGPAGAGAAAGGALRPGAMPGKDETPAFIKIASVPAAAPPDPSATAATAAS